MCSLGWAGNAKGEVVRTGNATATHLVFPEHLKYDQTQKAPYAALFDRLRAFLMTPDTLLISTGFSFADAHMEREMVASSTILSVGYDSASETLEIEFKGGGLYQYYNLPEAVYQDLMASDSKGKFHNVYIKNSFPFSRV
jgi:hypothetical protein